VSEVIVAFLQIILLANTATQLRSLFSAGISLTLFLRRQQRWGN